MRGNIVKIASKGRLSKIDEGSRKGQSGKVESEAK
jgi:hypothetical protein